MTAGSRSRLYGLYTEEAVRRSICHSDQEVWERRRRAGSWWCCSAGHTRRTTPSESGPPGCRRDIATSAGRTRRSAHSLRQNAANHDVVGLYWKMLEQLAHACVISGPLTTMRRCPRFRGRFRWCSANIRSSSRNTSGPIAYMAVETVTLQARSTSAATTFP